MVLIEMASINILKLYMILMVLICMVIKKKSNKIKTREAKSFKD